MREQKENVTVDWSNVTVLDMQDVYSWTADISDAQYLIIFMFSGERKTAATNPRTAVHFACSLCPWFEGQRSSGEVEVPCWSQPSKAGQSYRLLFQSLLRLLPGTLCSFSTRLLLSPRSGGSLTSDSRSQIIPPQSNTVLLDLSCRAALHCKNMFCSL